MFLIQQIYHFHISSHLSKSFIANEISVPIYCTQKNRYFLGLLNSYSEMCEGKGCGSGTHCILTDIVKDMKKDTIFSKQVNLQKSKNSALY